MDLRRRLAQLLVLVSGLCDAVYDPSKAEVSCDDILQFAFPDLCEMEVVRGTVVVRNLSVVYWRYRSKDGPTDKAPIITAHGGPGFAHNFILPMKQQACRGREIVFYDQVGTGESAQPTNVAKNAPWLLTIDYYNEEVQAIVSELKWTAFHFYGTSWGTVIGQSYALLQDPRLLSMVLNGPLSDTQLYMKAQWDPIEGNLGSLPLHVQRWLYQLGEEKAFESALYSKEDEILTYFFTTRTIPLPDCYLAATPTPTGQEIYIAMQGPSEFATTTGSVMENMNFTPRLPEIKVPVLLSHGRYDTMRPAVVNAMYRALPRAWRTMMPRSGHTTMIDEPRLKNDVVGDFYDHAESGHLHEFRPPPEARDMGDLPLTFSWPTPPPPWRLNGFPHSSSLAEILMTLLVGIAVGGVAGVVAMGKFGKLGHEESARVAGAEPLAAHSYNQLA